MSKDPWASPELSEPPAGWIRATENGWGALVLWAAGPGNFVRVPLAVGDRRGTTLTEADLGTIDDDVDTYLADAELPPRPRGYDWFIRPPDTAPGEDAFWSKVWAAATAGLPSDAVRPSALKGPVREAMTRMYAGRI